MAMRARSYTSGEALSPTTESTGSMGTTRPIRKVISRSPKNVIATIIKSRVVWFAAFVKRFLVNNVVISIRNYTVEFVV
jgi:hypothetical protein